MFNLIRLAATFVCCSFRLPCESPYSHNPIKSHTVRFEVDLTAGLVNPTGVGFRQVILVNGSFPGPTLELKVGDEVEFLVHNHLSEETAVHFHGITMRTTPWSDGVPGVSQAPIRPGASYLYKWNADDSGTFFYHAHNRGQIMDGLYGAMIVHAPQGLPRPFHMISKDPQDWVAMRAAEQRNKPILISDWSQYTFKQFYQVEQNANIDFTCMDAVVVNGAGSEYCLDRNAIDELTIPLVKNFLAEAGERMTDKGCVPPLQQLQGNFTVHNESIPTRAYRKCITGVGGKGNYTVNVHSRDKWAALTFINPGGLYPLKVTIDNHPLHVYAIDGQYVYPETVDQVLVNNGNRISVLVRLDQSVGSHTIRIANDLIGQMLSGFAQLTYNGVDEAAPHPRPLMDYAGHPTIPNLRKLGVNGGRPYPPRRPSRKADRTRKLVVRKLGQPHGSYEWSLSGKKGYNLTEEDKMRPLLFQDPLRVDNNETILKTRTGEWIDLILEAEGPFAQAHPMHKHGSKAFVIGAGIGSFPWADVEEASSHLPPQTFNWIDPPYRDSFQTLEGFETDTWMVLRYKVESPGAWLFHCHIQTHLTGGMGMVILDGIDQFPKVPEDYLEWNGMPKPRFEWQQQVV